MSDKPSFFSELKRRNVYKVAVAYILGGWALSQGIAQVFPVFDVPNRMIRLVVLLIIIGFPIALIIAWAFEVTPEGIKRTEAADAAGRDRLAYQIAEVFAVRGEKDKAFEWLQISFDNHDAGTLTILVDPLLRGLRDDPRYHNLVAEVGLPTTP